LAARRSRIVFDVVLRARGRGALKLLEESGGHRWQAKSGAKTHTSTVTVAVLKERSLDERFSPDDVRIIRTKGSGPGGQHVNKTQSTIVAIHEPTGISVRASDRKQGQNLKVAMDELERRVREGQREGWQAQVNALRQNLIGSGERGDKIKTYREQDGIVTNHRTGEKRRLAEVEAGRLA